MPATARCSHSLAPSAVAIAASGLGPLRCVCTYLSAPHCCELQPRGSLDCRRHSCRSRIGHDFTLPRSCSNVPAPRGMAHLCSSTRFPMLWNELTAKHNGFKQRRYKWVGHGSPQNALPASGAGDMRSPSRPPPRLNGCAASCWSATWTTRWCRTKTRATSTCWTLGDSGSAAWACLQRSSMPPAALQRCTRRSG